MAAAEWVEWHDAESAVAGWGDGQGLEDLDMLLDVCKEACWAFVPRSTRETIVPDGNDPDVPPDLVPPRFRLGQLRQAQNVARTAPGTDGQLGLDGYAPRAYVFGYDVRTILIPPVAGPAFF